MLETMPGSSEPKDENLLQRTQATLARYGSRFLGPYFQGGSVDNTKVYLIMSHDCEFGADAPGKKKHLGDLKLTCLVANQAVLTLKDDKPVLEFLGVARSHHVKKLNEILEKATKEVGGTLVHNPWFALMGHQVTVHPVGYVYYYYPMAVLCGSWCTDCCLQRSVHGP